jgi:hypothetical protein
MNKKKHTHTHKNIFILLKILRITSHKIYIKKNLIVVLKMKKKGLFKIIETEKKKLIYVYL